MNFSVIRFINGTNPKLVVFYLSFLPLFVDLTTLTPLVGGQIVLTVAATLLAAHRAGIRVFATGGIGGVHRGAAESLARVTARIPAPEPALAVTDTSGTGRR